MVRSSEPGGSAVDVVGKGQRGASSPSHINDLRHEVDCRLDGRDVELWTRAVRGAGERWRGGGRRWSDDVVEVCEAGAAVARETGGNAVELERKVWRMECGRDAGCDEQNDDDGGGCCGTIRTWQASVSDGAEDRQGRESL